MRASLGASAVVSVAHPSLFLDLVFPYRLGLRVLRAWGEGVLWSRIGVCFCWIHSAHRACICPRLFAVNHALTAASALQIATLPLWDVRAFEENALTAGLGDAPENLVQPGGSNYDWSVLHCNLQLAGLASHPMPPAALESRMLSPFALHYGDGFSYAPAAYILRTPQSGGHWIALLPPSVLNLEVSEAATSVLCDSLESIPYVFTFAETENLLTACALEGVRADAGFGHDISWGAFLITGPAMPAP